MNTDKDLVASLRNAVALANMSIANHKILLAGKDTQISGLQMLVELQKERIAALEATMSRMDERAAW